MSELEAVLLSYQKTLIRCMEDDWIGYEKANAPNPVEPESEPVDLGDLDLSGFDDGAAPAAVHPIQVTVEKAKYNPIHNRLKIELEPNIRPRGDFTVDLEGSANTPLPPSISRSQEKKNNGRLIKKAVAYSMTLAIVTALFYRFALEIYLKDLLLMLYKIIL